MRNRKSDSVARSIHRTPAGIVPASRLLARKALHVLLILTILQFFILRRQDRNRIGGGREKQSKRIKEAGRTARRRHVRCPWPTIKSSLSRKWATRRLKPKQNGGGRPLPPIFKFHLRPGLFRPRSRRPRPRPASTSAAAAAQFHFILLGCNRRRFSRSESMAPL